MAVQAQYPSNILLLLNRNGQDGNDYSLQQHPPASGGGGSGFLDQSPHILFHNEAGHNPRKRGRETVVHGSAGVAPAITNQNNNSAGTTTNNQSFSIQSSQQPPQLIDLSLLHRPQPNNISTGLRLSFSDHPPPPHQLLNLHHHHYQHNQNNNNNISNNNLVASQSPSSLLSEDFASHVKRHHEELDQFLLSQAEELRRTLAEKRQRQYRALVEAAEEALGKRLREKEAEMEKAARRNAELQARAAQLTVEAQVWQAKARAQEATAASLQAHLHQAIVAAPPDDGAGVEGQAEDAESAYVDPDRVKACSLTSGAGACRSCRRRVARVVALPCRHLSLCTECDQVAQTCPVCLQLRSSSVEVFLC